MACSALPRYQGTMPRSAAITALLVALVLALSPAAAPAQDHNRARDAVRSGQALPLSQVLGRVGGSYGQLLDAQLGNSGGRPVYQLRMLDAAGTVRNVTVDAGNGRVLGVRQGGRR